MGRDNERLTSRDKDNIDVAGNSNRNMPDTPAVWSSDILRQMDKFIGTTASAWLTSLTLFDGQKPKFVSESVSDKELVQLKPLSDKAVAEFSKIKQEVNDAGKPAYEFLTAAMADPEVRVFGWGENHFDLPGEKLGNRKFAQKLIPAAVDEKLMAGKKYTHYVVEATKQELNDFFATGDRQHLPDLMQDDVPVALLKQAKEAKLQIVGADWRDEEAIPSPPKAPKEDTSNHRKSGETLNEGKGRQPVQKGEGSGGRIITMMTYLHHYQLQREINLWQRRLKIFLKIRVQECFSSLVRCILLTKKSQGTLSPKVLPKYFAASLAQKQ
jgi:hypothetical protein